MEPGLANFWIPPIRNRIDMLATGIKSPVGVKVAGPDLTEIDRITGEIERAVKPVAGVTSALAERLSGGRYLDVTIDRDRASRFGLNIADVQEVVASAIGGDNVGETVDVDKTSAAFNQFKIAGDDVVGGMDDLFASENARSQRHDEERAAALIMEARKHWFE